MKLISYGAWDTVTGSLHYLESKNVNIIVDAGLFQGIDDVHKKNKSQLPIDLSRVDFIFLTHGHYDHCARLPLLVKRGFKGQIISSLITKEIAEVILIDAVGVMEDSGEILYSMEDVQETMTYFHTKKIGEWHEMENFKFYLGMAGHILGATWVALEIESKTIVFSGDLGRQKDLLIKPPEIPEMKVDLLVMESTYGNKIHSHEDPEKIFSEYLKRVKEEKKIWMIPSFALARTQNLMKLFARVFSSHHHLSVPLYVSSPMTEKIIQIYLKHKFHLNDPLAFEESVHIAKIAKWQKQLDKLDDLKGPAVIISSSGMMNGGRILRIVKHHGRDKNNLLTFAGFQSPGTLGEQILSGMREFEIGEKKNFILAAEVVGFDFLSSHADAQELYDWANKINPKQIYLIHGEENSQKRLKERTQKIAPTVISSEHHEVIL